MVSRPLHPMALWSGAPLSGTACSLELSLPSPAGIWFKTPLPVGGANTAALPPMGEMVSRHPKGYAEIPGQLQRLGVWGSPSIGATKEYPLNLRGASCPTLAMVTPACDWQGMPYQTAQKLFNVPPWAPILCLQAGSYRGLYLYRTAGVEPAPRGQEKGHGDDASGAKGG